jgi:hypothetical protein
MRLTPEQYTALLARRAPAEASAPSKSSVREAEIQDAIETLLKSFGRDCYYVRSRMDKPTTCKVGTPDFIGWLRGMPFQLEVKRPGAKETREQAGELMRGRFAGSTSAIVHSVAEAEIFFRGLSNLRPA